MTCAKKVVTAILTLRNGRQYTGDNRCYQPQDKCPRLPGEGYGKCWSVCLQPFHAERDAINQAIDNDDMPHGGHMIINHHRACSDCQDLMRSYEITWSCTETKRD